ncbi:hypothetical protein E2C01_056922 [Portunus trituberculatus]|uniref:Uncharacterized protein n=1 Tax=Portunus trituberculatus TaxID=210409 RepID=A0A5B7GVF9_PORTR|nr:hypothetical protein [Portunus trituberculatus]
MADGRRAAGGCVAVLHRVGDMTRYFFHSRIIFIHPITCPSQASQHALLIGGCCSALSGTRLASAAVVAW